MGVLTVAAGFGLALGLTMLGMNVVLSLLPSRQSAEQRAAANARASSDPA